MIGVLVDVSGSMQSAYSLDGSSHSVNVERTQAVFTTVVNIVNKEMVRHRREDKMFVGAFGLLTGGDTESKSDTCDLLTLLEYQSDPLYTRIDSHEELIKMARYRGHTGDKIERWIKNHLTKSEANFLHKALCSDPPSIDKLADLIPNRGADREHTARQSSGWFETVTGCETVSGFVTNKAVDGLQSADNVLSFFGATSTPMEDQAVRFSSAYKYAHQKIYDTVYRVKPRRVKDVAQVLDNLLHGSSSSSDSASSSSSRRIQEIIEPVKPYIYGRTPMCKAMSEAEEVFKEAAGTDKKVLFILSDGMSTDGDPLPIAQRLRSAGVTIATCYITADDIHNPRCLLDPPDDRQWKLPWILRLILPWNSGQQALMELSSTMKNTDAPVSYLVDANWELPLSGESCLFARANSLDVVNEFCRILVSQLTDRSCDALIHMLGKVPLATYINQKNAEFEPKLQIGGTCYANATAAVLHLAMNRIVGREGGIPSFEDILKRIVDEFKSQGANTEKVLKKVCPEYRLHCQKVDEKGARQAINMRRPVVATFRLYERQWEKFEKFYKVTPKQILQKSDVNDQTCTVPGGHAVVLIRCDPDCLTFMNSWSTKWGDGGFFRVKDQNVLNNTKFYDVYWTEEDLKPSEKVAYERKCAKKIRELAETYPSTLDLLHTCPECNNRSKVSEFTGDILEAKCPVCSHTFVPTNEAIMESLYCKTLKY